MAKLAGSDNFFNDLQSGLDRLKKGLDDAKQNKTSSFGDMRKGLEQMKRAKDSTNPGPKRKTNASTQKKK